MDERDLRQAFRSAFDGSRPSPGAVDRAFARVGAEEAAAYGAGRRLAGAAAVALALLLVATLLIARGALTHRQAAVPAAGPVATPTATAAAPTSSREAPAQVNQAPTSVVAAFNDQIVLAGWTAGGQLRLTNDGGATWKAVWLPAGALLDLQWVNGDTVLAATGGGLYAFQRTTSGWTRLSSRTDLVRLDFSDRTSGFAVTASGDVVETQDGGATFATLNVGLHPVTWLQWVSQSSAWAAGPAGVVATRDGGVTWVRQLTFPAAGVVRAQVGFRDEANGFALFDFADGKRSGFVVYHTADAGATWTPEGCTCALAAPPDWLARSAAPSLPAAPLHSDLVVTGPSSATLVSADARPPAARICATTDSGRDWSCVPFPYQGDGPASLAVRGRSWWLSGFAVGGGPVLAYSPDGGATWTTRQP